VIVVALLWAALTAVGEVWVFRTAFNPEGYAHEATLIDGTFQTLMMFGVPVFAFVVAALGYALLRFRAPGDPPPDGPPIREHGPITVGWLAATSALAVLIIVNPGLTGMAHLRAEAPPDLVVQVQGTRFSWRITYPEHGVVTTKELVLPVSKRVRFGVTAADVVHSFWIPGFRVKIDAVPGRVTVVHATPDRLGSYEQDVGLRLQCAELCGAGHAVMATPVRVVTEAAFAAWIALQHATK
jgi:cytochrome c oxidase subunit 2